MVTADRATFADPEPIETERLRLRIFRPDDVDRVAPYFADPEVMKWMSTGQPVPRERVELAISRFIERFRENGFGLFAVELKESGTVIGHCGIIYLDNTPEVEIGYLLGQPYWGKGYATEAATAARDFGFNVVGLQRLVGIIRPGNVRSRRVLEKIGLRYEKDAFYYNMDCKYFALNRGEYERQRQWGQ
ncbi:MAG: GNAT family N-acetyltransferase [Chloroflexota bacterium]|nr:GNAT family N-acetyltransferase [Chloroflexota bacterium]